MAKPDPSLLDPKRYPFTCEIETRYGDLDTNAHINNVALVSICQEGRTRFHRASGFNIGSTGVSAMIVSHTIEYLGQGQHPSPITVLGAVIASGRTSQTMAQLLMQDGRVLAYAQSVIICTRDGKPTALPVSFLETIADWMLRP